jgi:hypothetical protein
LTDHLKGVASSIHGTELMQFAMQNLLLADLMFVFVHNQYKKVTLRDALMQFYKFTLQSVDQSQESKVQHFFM